jgi:hypothetical protein
MPSRKSTYRRSTATTAANEIFTTTIHGAKDLKEYIDRITEIVQGVRREFDCDVQQPRARVEEPVTFLGSRKFDVTMCRVDHDGVIHSETKLPQCSKFLQAEQAINEQLKMLEDLRKMLVTNEHQRNRTVKNLKKTRNQVSAALKSVLSGCVDELELEPEIPGDKEIKSLIQQQIQQVQQNHRTVARNLCMQAEMIIRALRTRDILAYKLAAENTIQKIIHHADLCRKFIAECREIARIEYCASAWWMETQRDPMDHSPYYVTAVSEGEPTRFKAAEMEYSGLFSGRSSPPRILIEVHCANRYCDDNSCVVVFSQYLDQELAETILTEEAVAAFEEDEEPTTYRRDYGTIISNQYPPPASNEGEGEGEYDDDDEDEKSGEDEEAGMKRLRID